jgi:hypothetical protein
MFVSITASTSQTSIVPVGVKKRNVTSSGVPGSKARDDESNDEPG